MTPGEGEGEGLEGGGVCDLGYRKNMKKSNRVESPNALLKLIIFAGNDERRD